MRRRLAIIAVLTGLVLGCLSMLSLAQETSAESQKELTSANTKFSFNLFSKLMENKGQNVFIAPASVAFGLAMTYNGAAAETQQAMARTLEIQGLSLDALNQGNARLLRALRSQLKVYSSREEELYAWEENFEKKDRTDLKIGLGIANSLWLDQRQEFKPEFLKSNEEFYGAYLKVLDFSNLQAPETINAWVAKETTGKITQIVDKIEPPLLLISTIYFKGAWSKRFDRALTKEHSFTLSTGREKSVLMMAQSLDYRSKYMYYRGKNFQAVRLPYGDKGRFGMRIFLPDKKSSLKKFLGELNAANWQQWLSGFQSVNGAIMLPRFKLEYEASLKEPLTALGMAVAFDKHQANFSNLCSITPSTNVYIKDIKHKTFMAVDEEGTEAAGATAIMLKSLGIDGPPEKTFKMIVDRPFFVVIDDSSTGELLFLGAIVDPEQ